MSTAHPKAALRLESIERRYAQGEGTLEILRGANFTVMEGQSVALVAPSGTGKSTLIRCINRLVTPTSGRILLNLAGEQVD
ncbi:MAG: ATP-binding cassette domain-containing protein, partial [Starkeya sp.]|nr:ATP-binding cassette domain-containing protein [Starkeya sp.]